MATLGARPASRWLVLPFTALAMFTTLIASLSFLFTRGEYLTSEDFLDTFMQILIQWLSIGVFALDFIDVYDGPIAVEDDSFIKVQGFGGGTTKSAFCHSTLQHNTLLRRPRQKWSVRCCTE